MGDGARILVVEDAKEFGALLERGLSEEGYSLTVVATATEALRKMHESWDLVILDLMLPDMPGETILDYLTQTVDRPPVIVLTARSGLSDKVELFKRGCDDYLTKPFAFEELVARVRALLRRSPKALGDGEHFEDMSLDPLSHVLSTSTAKVTLTPKEFAIVRSFFRRKGALVSRKELLGAVWGSTYEPRTNYLEVHLANLRKKLSQVQREDWIHTVRSAGFVFQRPQ